MEGDVRLRSSGAVGTGRCRICLSRGVDGIALQGEEVCAAHRMHTSSRGVGGGTGAMHSVEGDVPISLSHQSVTSNTDARRDLSRTPPRGQRIEDSVQDATQQLRALDLDEQMPPVLPPVPPPPFPVADRQPIPHPPQNENRINGRYFCPVPGCSAAHGGTRV